MTRDCDVAIVGGGMVGAALALLLVRHGRVPAARILIVEPKPAVAPAPGSPIGLRVSNIAPGNRERLQQLGVWAQLDASRVASVQRMAIWHEGVPADSPDVLRFDAAEQGAAELGAIVENDALQAALLAQCQVSGITLLQDRVRSLAIESSGAQLELEQGTVRAQLVVGADGAASAVRGMAGLPAGTRDYGQRAIVAVVRTSRPHHGTAWQRFLDTGPLALLPLPGDSCSIVWSATEARAAALMALPAPEFDAALTVASAGVLGNLEVTGERAAFALRRLQVQKYVAPRLALVGDAAHVIHPLAGQGVNQGFEDAAALALQLGQRPERESPGALAALRRYERERRAGNALMGGVVDGLDRLFTGSGPLTSWVARSGMALVARAAPLRRLLVRQAAGAAGRSWPRR